MKKQHDQECKENASVGQRMYIIASCNIKRESFNRFQIKNYQQAKILIFEYIEAFYNTARIRGNCNYMSPAQFEITYQKVENAI